MQALYLTNGEEMLTVKIIFSQLGLGHVSEKILSFSPKQFF